MRLALDRPPGSARHQPSAPTVWLGAATRSRCPSRLLNRRNAAAARENLLNYRQKNNNRQILRQTEQKHPAGGARNAAIRVLKIWRALYQTAPDPQRNRRQQGPMVTPAKAICIRPAKRPTRQTLKVSRRKATALNINQGGGRRPPARARNTGRAVARPE